MNISKRKSDCCSAMYSLVSVVIVTDHSESISRQKHEPYRHASSTVPANKCTKTGRGIVRKLVTWYALVLISSPPEMTLLATSSRPQIGFLIWYKRVFKLCDCVRTDHPICKMLRVLHSSFLLCFHYLSIAYFHRRFWLLDLENGVELWNPSKLVQP